MPKIVDKEQKRQLLREAAVAVFVEQGYQASTVEMIAERAGVSKGLIYVYFDSKEEIFFSVFAWLSEEVFGEALAPVAQINSPRKRLMTMVRIWAEQVSEMRHLLPAFLDFWAAASSGTTR